MTVDSFVSQEFSYQGDTYPGSKQKRAPAPVMEPEKEVAPWDARPYVKSYKGVPTEFFTIEALCIALDRPAVTVRLWIRNGYIPEATLRLPARDVKGSKQLNRRLYTRGQVEAVIKVFEDHGIRQNCRVKWADHGSVAIEILEAWTALRAV
jgi:hypothetical protein